MTPELSARDARALRVLAVGVAIATAWFGRDAVHAVLPPPASVEALEQKYLLARKSAGLRPALERDVRSASRSLRLLEERLLQAETPSLAQAEIRSLSTRLLGEAGIRSAGSEFGVVAEDSHPYVSIPLDLEFACETDQLVRFMAGTANARPILATRMVQIRREDPEARTVRVRMTIEGYLRADRGDPPPPELAGGSG